MQKVVHLGKVRETFLNIWISISAESKTGFVPCHHRLYRLIYIEDVGLGRPHGHKIRCSVTGSLCSVFEFMGLQSHINYQRDVALHLSLCLSAHNVQFG